MPTSVLVWVHSFIAADFFRKQCIVRQYHSDLSDQYALEIRVRLRVALGILAFFVENDEND